MPYKDPARAAKWAREHRPKGTLKGHRVKREKVRQFLHDYKLASGCHDCGYRENADALEFAHLDRRFGDNTRKAGWQYSWAHVAQVLEECIVLCANCHAIDSNADRRADLCR
jgi:hypothetical protein